MGKTKMQHYNLYQIRIILLCQL